MKTNRKNSLLLVILVLVAAIALTGCGKKDPLLGKWQEPTSGITMEFNKDGKLVMGNKGASITVSYLQQEPNILIFKASTDGSIPDQTMTYRVEEDKLILTVDGIETVFSKAK
ncbi:MAG: hypothetical protein FD147_1957 [Chloroflexi bacterium]|nr:MAG: hypothetical protein FD147_1957 [Chloroflexota bacterium]